MAKYGMIIDLDKCIGCKACVIACRAEWELQDDRSRCWVKPLGPLETGDVQQMVYTFYVGQCNHCENPSCISECPTSATYKDENGLVLVNKDLCIGCGNCVVACPYGARFTSSIDNKVEKCTFCNGRIQQGLQPACVQTCPTEARIFGNLEDRNSVIYQKISKENYYVLETKKQKLSPHIYYRGKEKDLEAVFQYCQPETPITSIANQLWAGVTPWIQLSFGMSLVGVIGAFIHQLIKGESDDEH